MEFWGDSLSDDFQKTPFWWSKKTISIVENVGWSKFFKHDSSSFFNYINRMFKIQSFMQIQLESTFKMYPEQQWTYFRVWIDIGEKDRSIASSLYSSRVRMDVRKVHNNDINYLWVGFRSIFGKILLFSFQNRTK